MRAQTWGDKVHPKNKDWTECVFVCARVRHTLAFSESIRPFALSANIWECDNCRECENILCTGRLRFGSRNPPGCFTNAWPFCDHGVGGDQRGKDNRCVLSMSECGWRLESSGWKGMSRKDDQYNTGRIMLSFVSYSGSQRHFIVRGCCAVNQTFLMHLPPKVKTLFICRSELIHIVSLVTDFSGGCSSFFFDNTLFGYSTRLTIRERPLEAALLGPPSWW